MEFEVRRHIESKDIDEVRAIVSKYHESDLVLQRIKENVRGNLQDINRDRIWHTLLMCLLTSQQKSGRGSQVEKLLRASDQQFQLSLPLCQKQKMENLEQFVVSTLNQFGGIRRSPTIAKQIKENLIRLEQGGWDNIYGCIEELKQQLAKSPIPDHFKLERTKALNMQHNKDKGYVGLGPKQSRNFWQALGLTRYEFVLDSRMTTWLKDIGFPVFFRSSNALSSEEYYASLSDILREICVEAGVFPCVLDAAVFVSSDKRVSRNS